MVGQQESPWFAARSETGQALVEYGLVLALVAVVALGSLTLIGTYITALLNAVVGLLGSIAGTL